MIANLLQPPPLRGPFARRPSSPLLCFGLLLGVLFGGTARSDTDSSPSINPSYESSTTGSHAAASEADTPIERLNIDLRQGSIEERVERVLALMTLEEKIGQLSQRAAFGDTLPEQTAKDLRAGRVGSLFYTGSAEQTREAKRIAREESRLGLPLLTPRDVIHGFRTVFPIPLGQAASWDPELIREAAGVAAREAKAVGVNWTFAPMLDIARDARWGRIAESLGEDPLLAASIAEAMVRGFQESECDGTATGIAACAKHFVAYGLSEGGRDYNRAQVAISELHNVFLAPFQSAVKADCATVMTGFSSVNGVPGTGHAGLVRGVLKQRWGFDGLVVSDWGSVIEMIEHGYAADEAQAGEMALRAGVDMEMATNCYQDHLGSLLSAGRLTADQLDDAVRRVLRTKLRFALEEDPGTIVASEREPSADSLETARRLARESIVLLKNDNRVLPLQREAVSKVAVIGPLADAARDQLGCWMLDGKPEEAITPLAALRSALEGQAKIRYVAGLESSIDENDDHFAEAVEAARWADLVVLCTGEEFWLSGEARCRVDIDLPGAQRELVAEVTSTGTPTVLVVLAGRPLTIGDEIARCDAVLYAWHPGTMGGPALADLLLGDANPSGKLPVTFPKHVGQSPLYYNHPNTGRPPLTGTAALIGSGQADFPEEQKYRSHYLDVDPFPLLPFGYGLSYTEFEYSDLELSTPKIGTGQTLGVRVRLTNTGDRPGVEVAQLYIRDVTASLVRPVRELKAFRRVRLEPGESRILEFALGADRFCYYNNSARSVSEPGVFRIGVGGDSTVSLDASCQLMPSVGAPQASEQAVTKQSTTAAR